MGRHQSTPRGVPPCDGCPGHEGALPRAEGRAMPAAGADMGAKREQAATRAECPAGASPSQIGPRSSGGHVGGEGRDFDRGGGFVCNGIFLPG
eukprot:8408780-Pyramimonas_sp.AAC.1